MQREHILFVHGMGRSPLSAWWMLRHLRRAGYPVETFYYVVTFERFGRIVDRLHRRLSALAGRGEYIVIGHSLGGVLLRAALNRGNLPRQPRKLFLLGSPLQASTIAKRMRRKVWYRLLTRDCGDLLADDLRMREVGTATAPAIAIVGTRDSRLSRRYLEGRRSDGVVLVEEATADWLAETVYVDELHMLLPVRRRTAEIILLKMLPDR